MLSFRTDSQKLITLLAPPLRGTAKVATLPGEFRRPSWVRQGRALRRIAGILGDTVSARR